MEMAQPHTSASASQSEAEQFAMATAFTSQRRGANDPRGTQGKRRSVIQFSKARVLGIQPVSVIHYQMLLSVLAKGIDVLGNEKELRGWLTVPFWGLTIQPLEMLKSIKGTQQVYDQLVGLEFGHVV